MLQLLLISCCHELTVTGVQQGENGFKAVFILKIEDKGQKLRDS